MKKIIEKKKYDLVADDNIQSTTDPLQIEKYQISLLFVKKGEVLLIRNDVGKLTIPVSMTSWNQSPEEHACDVAYRILSMRIDQFDYPLGFQKIRSNKNTITSYALLPSMWKESELSCNIEWFEPLAALAHMTEQSRDIVSRYYSRVENYITFGSYHS